MLAQKYVTIIKYYSNTDMFHSIEFNLKLRYNDNSECTVLERPERIQHRSFLCVGIYIIFAS